MFMDVQLIRATANEAQDMLNIQKKCFKINYEKAGYTLTGVKEIINDKLTLVYYKK